MLRPIVFDLSKEEAVPSRAGTHKFVDLCSNAASIMIEVKWIGHKGRWKRIVEQIHIDTQSYVAHPACKDLIFVIVDAVRDIQDPRRLESELSGAQRIGDRQIQIGVLVVEP
jgi:REase_DpnII-MboI